MFELLGSAIARLIFRPVMAFYQGLAGILYPVQTARLIAMQRLAMAFLAVAAVSFVGLCVMLVIGRQSSYVWLSLSALWFLSALVSGVLGGHIEKARKRIADKHQLPSC